MGFEGWFWKNSFGGNINLRDMFIMGETNNRIWTWARIWGSFWGDAGI